ncbi:hypothetical protein AVEN_173491-1 [Araneus ventricosus]|uniref:Tc1-like transposase DDE domain-containing protein n=1 Tax=Araneus ventricosus TaxID=182803 RepID=A0A4Y2KJH8_ARAVE|nr:hypothetical protein AVEN_173491-1 [Araneus ventricosus]
MHICLVRNSQNCNATQRGRKEKRKGIISDFLEGLPFIDLRNVWFQHVGASPNKVSSVLQYIRETFQQQVIGYGVCVEWPPRSPDLNPLDFFLWGCIKKRVYATPPPTLQDLRNRITDICANVSPAMLYNVQRELQSHVEMCIVAEGHHFEHDRWMSLISGKCSFVQRDQTNVRFVLFICTIFVRKMFFCNKSMMLKNFVIDFFPVFRTVFEIRTLTTNFAFR